MPDTSYKTGKCIVSIVGAYLRAQIMALCRKKAGV
jgi:hypothetical protein